MTGLDWPTALEIQFLYYRMRYFAERNATYVAVRSANMLCAGRNTDKRNVENWFFEMPMQKSGLEAKAKFKSKIQIQIQIQIESETAAESHHYGLSPGP